MKSGMAVSVIALLFALFALSVNATQRAPLADDVETPDPLVIKVDQEADKKRYGEEKIFIQRGGEGSSAQETPDPLERGLEKKETGKAEQIYPSKPAEGEVDKKTPGQLEKNMDSLITPDPLLDSVDQ